MKCFGHFLMNHPGYTKEGLSQLHGIEAGVDILEQPFRVCELVRRVRAALDRGRSGLGNRASLLSGRRPQARSSL